MQTAIKTHSHYDTVYRHEDNTFTGIPIAKLHKGVWYWPDYQTARNFAVAFDLPIDRIIPYSKGWAIQMKVSGPYVEAPRS